MDCIYQDDDVLVEKGVEVLQDASFDGEDAKEVWLDGYEFQKPRMPTSRGRQQTLDKLDYSWPFYKDGDKVSNYTMWRDRDC